MKKVDLHNLKNLKPPEGSIDLIYGRIGNGKTAEATRRILVDLSKGQVVYANWPIDLRQYEFDDRDSFWRHLLNTIFFQKHYYKFDKKNFHYVEPENLVMEKTPGKTAIGDILDANVYVDEGQWILDSYAGTKFSMESRKAILHTRHDGRRIVIVTQRPSAIQVSARGNVNRFFKCTKVISFPIMILKVEEFQDMEGEMPDESKESRTSKHYHIMNRKLFRTYNSKYLRGNKEPLYKAQYEVYELNFRERLFGLITAPFKGIFASVARAPRRFIAEVHARGGTRKSLRDRL